AACSSSFRLRLTACFMCSSRGTALRTVILSRGADDAIPADDPLPAFGGYNRGMKPLPAPHVPGKTEFERFDNAMRQVLSVSKEELLKRDANWKRTRARKKKLTKKTH